MLDNSKEGFDEKIINANIENCARFCKMTAKCAGFSYDKNNSICYPSVTPILGKPGSSIYRNDYNKKFTTCNKLFTMTEPINESSETIKKPNSIFLCMEDGKDNYFIAHNYKDIYELDPKKENKNPYDDYPIKPYVWANENDLQISPVDWNKIKDNYEPSKNSIDVVDVHSINQIMDEKNNMLLDYKKTNLMSDGDFYKTYQCIDEVPLTECLNYCNGKEDCVGVEFNQSFIRDNIIRKNVCCPKVTIGNLVERSDDYKNGNFYVKQMIKNII